MEFKKNFNEIRSDIVALIFFVILSMITLIWIDPNHVIYYNTAYFPFSPYQNFIDTLFVHSYFNFGIENFGITSVLNFPYYLFISAVSSFTNIYIAEAIFWSFNVFLAGIGGY